MKRIAILQSSYIPWKGYFDLINMVDEFIIYDDAQYTKRDWRNRNRIKTSKGTLWLTIPVKVKGKYSQKIKDTIISDSKWNEKHWKTINHHYSKVTYFKKYCELFENLYRGMHENYLSKVNYKFIITICEILGIRTTISWSMDYHLEREKTKRLVGICKQSGATEYLTGPAAINYIDKEIFRKEGISLRYIDYSGYPIYNQVYPSFEHKVSIIDLIFNVGPDASHYMKSFKLNLSKGTQ